MGQDAPAASLHFVNITLHFPKLQGETGWAQAIVHHHLLHSLAGQRPGEIGTSGDGGCLAAPSITLNRVGCQAP
jgi:hypothetical protein